MKNPNTKTHCSSTRYRMPQPAQRVISTALLSMIPTWPRIAIPMDSGPQAREIRAFGTMPRNSSDIRGPGYDDEDFGISKVIPNPRKIQADFRGEMFDALNRHIFTRPDSNLSSTNVSVGQIGGLQNGPRNVQFRLRITY